MRKLTRHEPPRERTACPSDAMDLEPIQCDGAAERQVSPVDANHVRQRGYQVEIDLEPRVLETELDPVALIDEPPVAAMLRLIGEAQLDRAAPTLELGGPHVKLERPQQQAQIDLVLGKLASRPSLSPHPERFDQGFEFISGAGEVIGPAPAARRPATLDDTLLLELLQPPRQERWRGKRNTSLELGVEFPGFCGQWITSEK